MATEKHAGDGVPLRVDKGVHTGGNHGRQRAEQIDHQVRIGVWQGGIRGAEQLRIGAANSRPAAISTRAPAHSMVNEVFMI